MPRTWIAITVDSELLEELDGLIARGRFPNRNRAIEGALAEKLQQDHRTRLARECDKLNPREEQALAEEGVGATRRYRQNTEA